MFPCTHDTEEIFCLYEYLKYSPYFERRNTVCICMRSLFRTQTVIFRSKIAKSTKLVFNPYPLLVVWNDAANKVGISVSESCHQFGERFLVQLPNSTKHALLGLVCRAKSSLCHTSDLIQAHNTIHWEWHENKIKQILTLVRYKNMQYTGVTVQQQKLCGTNGRRCHQ